VGNTLGTICDGKGRRHPAAFSVSRVLIPSDPFV
jgi:hypothetical protein